LKNHLKEKRERKTKIQEELKNLKNLKQDTNLKFMKYQYDGWELPFFDKAKNFRNYQFLLIKNYLKGDIAEIGPGNGENLKYTNILQKKYSYMSLLRKVFLNCKKILKIKIYS
jgi:hypothetical protein